MSESSSTILTWRRPSETAPFVLMRRYPFPVLNTLGTSMPSTYLLTLSTPWRLTNRNFILTDQYSKESWQRVHSSASQPLQKSPYASLILYLPHYPSPIHPLNTAPVARGEPFFAVFLLSDSRMTAEDSRATSTVLYHRLSKQYFLISSFSPFLSTFDCHHLITYH